MGRLVSEPGAGGFPHQTRDPNGQAMIVRGFMLAVILGFAVQLQAVPAGKAGFDSVVSVFFKANCVKCHGVSGLGDGQANDYDDWNKVVLQAQKTVDGGVKQAEKASTWDMSAEEREEHRMELAWLDRFETVLDGNALRPRMIRPRNLRQGVYRGGMRPLDLYYRIHSGINGAPMPAAKGTVPPEDIWHIVNYIKSLPYDFNGTLGVDRPMVARDRM